ncbi:hypothetical protein AQUCO_01700390v1 [Aquilegia coerulea]|uniref:Uncharacterized protein n=1 Tax=Aquilegia coerulea TaxID=218851 RepID=A0A2G5DMN2_AQUCA|nr:hypothetical protein AQUCO_01700390v1 [Aquilegia coerulea]
MRYYQLFSQTYGIRLSTRTAVSFSGWISATFDHQQYSFILLRQRRVNGCKRWMAIFSLKLKERAKIRLQAEVVRKYMELLSMETVEEQFFDFGGSADPAHWGLA